jgi:predicted nucleic acid-binding protein
MSLVCFDNHVLIWGIKEQSTEGQEDKIALAKSFIENLKNDDLVIIPSIVLAEFLIPIPPQLHAMVINLFTKKFLIAPFDALAASKFSLIWQTNKPPEVAKQLIEDDATKAELRADSMIVATAVAQKAECIYSYDKGIKSFAKGFIEVKEIPFLPKQSTSFPPDDKRDWGKLPKTS